MRIQLFDQPNTRNVLLINTTVTFFSRFMMTCCSDVGDLDDRCLMTSEQGHKP